MPNVSSRELVLGRIANILAAMPGVSVERNRRSQPDASEAPVMVVYDAGHSASSDSAGLSTYDMQVLVEATVSAPDDSGLGPAVNALYSDTILALMADTTLSGAATDMAEVSFDVRVATVDESSDPLAFSTLTLTVQFFTDYGNPIAA